MTVATEQSSEVYTSIADGVPLNVEFPVQAATELKVRYGAADTVATLGVHYTVALVPPEYLTATVTPMTGFAALSGGTVSVRREVPYTQPTDIPTLASLASARLEQMFDRIVFICQQLRDALASTLKFPTTDTAANIAALPTATERASKYLGFDVNGKPIAVAGAAAPDVAMTTFGLTWVQLLDALAGRTALSVYSQAETTAAIAASTAAAIPKAVVDAAGDLLVGTANDAVGRLPIGANNRFLKVIAGALAYDQVDIATVDITGVLPRANGGFVPEDDTEVLGSNVAMNATATWFDGPTISVAAGRWLVEGSVTVQNTVGGDIVDVQLWDGTNVIASTRMHLVSVAGTYYGHAHLSGRITDPAANVRLSVRPSTRTDGAIAYNASGRGRDSVISVLRIG